MKRMLWLCLPLLCALSCAGSGESDEPDEMNAPVVLAAQGSSDEADLLAGELEQPLKAARAQQMYGLELDLETMRALYEYGVANPGDARPWLLLARDAMRTQQYGFAVRYYRMAIRADQRAKSQPNVLRDLLAIVRTVQGGDLEECRALIVDSWDGEILDRVEAAKLSALQDGDLAGAQHLAKLRDELEERAATSSGDR